jgi:catechol 2,3-dioxygenase-like lactoylglutathione lyase family enzyme
MRTPRAGAIHHLDLTVSDFRRSKEFYARVLPLMGFERLPKEFGAVAWRGASIIAIQPASPEEQERAHSRRAPGFHHLALQAPSRAAVDRLHTELVQLGVTILDPPTDYPYSAGYYAVFFADPDGLKLEYVHAPALPVG